MNGETTTSSWFKVTREVFSLGILQSSEWDKITVWLFLLSSAAHHPHEAQVHGRCFALERGQCALSVNDLADKAGWKRMRLRYFLRQLVKEGMISMAGGKSGTVLSIANYDKWQLNQPISQPISQVKQAPVLAMSSLCSQVSSQPISQASEEVSSHTLFQEGSAVEGSLEEKEGGQRIQPAIASRPPAFVKLSNEQDVQEVMKSAYRVDCQGSITSPARDRFRYVWRCTSIRWKNWRGLSGASQSRIFCVVGLPLRHTHTFERHSTGYSTRGTFQKSLTATTTSPGG
jgi:predicted transcriptional regulator